MQLNEKEYLTNKSLQQSLLGDQGKSQMSLGHAGANALTDASLSIPINDQPSALTRIYEPEYNIAVWQRGLDTELGLNIEEMLLTGVKLALVQWVTPENSAEFILKKLAGFVCAQRLANDIAQLTDMFCCLFDIKEAGLRLTSIDRPMCPKFHVDHLPCRLVTSYAGASTQWLMNSDVDRRKLGTGSLGQFDHLSGVYTKDSMIKQMELGDVALLKGSGWEGNEQTGLVHRSPAKVSDERRLLLTLDMV